MLKTFNLNTIHTSWQPCIKTALEKLNPAYLQELYTHQDWLPGCHHIFSAFSLPLEQTRYVLFGESPYPRRNLQMVTHFGMQQSLNYGQNQD